MDRHLEVVRYLHDNFHKHCAATNAHREAARFGCMIVARYLKRHCTMSE